MEREAGVHVTCTWAGEELDSSVLAAERWDAAAAGNIAGWRRHGRITSCGPIFPDTVTPMRS